MGAPPDRDCSIPSCFPKDVQRPCHAPLLRSLLVVVWLQTAGSVAPQDPRSCSKHISHSSYNPLKQSQLPGCERLKFTGILGLLGSPGAAPVSSWLPERVWAPSPLLPRSHINLQCSYPSPFAFSAASLFPARPGADLHLCHSLWFSKVTSPFSKTCF